MATDQQRLFTPAFITLTLCELCYFLAAGLVIGVTPFFVLGPVGSDAAGLGLAFGAFSITALVLRPFAGRQADRRGRRPLLIGGAVGAAAVIVLHAVTTDLAALVVLRLALGVAEACFFVAGFAALADLAPPGRSGEALSINSLALYLGLALGPLVGEGLLELGGYTLAWLGGGGLALAAVATAIRLPETAPASAADAPPSPWLHRGAIGPSIALFAGVATMSGFLLLGGTHAADLGLETWSLVLLAFGGTVVGCRLAFARLPDRVPPLRLAGVVLVGCAAGSALCAASADLATLFAGTIVLGVGVAFLTPAVFAAIFAVVEPAERGSAAGTASAFIDLAFGLGPIGLGAVASGGGPSAAFAVGAIVSLAGAASVAARPRQGLTGVQTRPA
jgi:MFS family permease